MEFYDESQHLIMGHIVIRDITDKENIIELVNKKNAIHYENMSIALAKSLAQKQDGHLYWAAFGNGAVALSDVGTLTYNTPNAIGQLASLYNETYQKAIYENNIEIRHASGTLYSDVVITILLDFGEPTNQSAYDDIIDFNNQYMFNELALKSYDKQLLTHVIFHPVVKSLNRTLEITYTIRIMMA